jgi:hypothetical protein
MSLDSSKKAILLAGVIVGLVAATALVAGYVERPGQAAGVAANEHNCGGCCPLAGTDACCRAKCQGESGDECCGACAQPGCAAPSACQMKAEAGCGPMGCSQTQ